jgi:hypothetical protein
MIEYIYKYIYIYTFPRRVKPWHPAWECEVCDELEAREGGRERERERERERDR